MRNGTLRHNQNRVLRGVTCKMAQMAAMRRSCRTGIRAEDPTCDVRLPAQYMHNREYIAVGGITVLRLDWQGSKTALHRGYVGWRKAIVTEDAIVMSKILAEAFGITEGILVDVTPILDAPPAKTIEVECATVDDWEILETNTGAIERYLLQQVQVLTPDVVFPFWISSANMIKLRMTKGPALGFAKLVVGVTELHIAPKPRKREEKETKGNVFSPSTSSTTTTQSEAVPTSSSSTVPTSRENTEATYPVESLRVQSLNSAPPSSHILTAARTIWVNPHTLKSLKCTEGGLVVVTAQPTQALSTEGLEEAWSESVNSNNNSPYAETESHSNSKRFSVLQICSTSLCARKHVMLPDMLRQRLRIPLFSTVSVHAIAHLQHREFHSLTQSVSSSSVTSIMLRQVIWSLPTHTQGGGESAFPLAAQTDPFAYSNRIHSSAKLSRGFLTWLQTHISSIYSYSSQETETQTPALPFLNGSLVSFIDTLSGVVITVAVYALDPRDRESKTETKSNTRREAGSTYFLLPSLPPNTSGSDFHAFHSFQATQSLDIVVGEPERVTHLYDYLPALSQDGRVLSRSGGGGIGFTFPPPSEPQSTQTQNSNTQVKIIKLETKSEKERECVEGTLVNDKFPPLYGLESVWETCRAKLHNLLSPDLVLNRYLSKGGGLHPGGIILCSTQGCGKSSLALSLAHHFRSHPQTLAYTVWIPCGRLTQLKIGEVKESVRAMLHDAACHAPSLIVFDDIDLLVPSIPSGGGSPGLDTDKIRALQLSEFLQDELSDLLSKFPQLPIAYLATAKSRTSYHPTLQMTGPGLFTTRVEIKPPDQSTRVLVLKSFFSKLDTPDRQRKPGHGNMTYVILHPEANLDAVALDCEGYTGQDLQRMIQKAIHVATARALIDREQKNEITPLNVIVNQSDLDHARKDFIPNALKDLPPALESETKWSDIGGLEDVKSTLKETLQLPTRFSRIFSQLPLKLRSGLLLYGPPGCGKTLLASAVAAECGLNFVSIKGPELLNKYIGASEQAVRDAFERAAAASPCVLFLDEFEAIAPKRGGDSTGVTDRVVNQFLTLLDGVEGRTGVYVLAATSRPDLIDPALLRPGRLDKCLYCKLPDASDRARILLAIAHKMKLITQTVSEEKVTQYLALAKKSPLDIVRESKDGSFTVIDSGFLVRVGVSCEGYTGADLQALVTTAQIQALHRVLEEEKKLKPGDSKTTETKQGKESTEGGFQITRHDILDALSSSSRSLSDKELARFQGIYSKFVSARQDRDNDFDPKKQQRTSFG